MNLCECAACMACNAFKTAFNATLSCAARLVHFLLLVMMFVFAIVLGKYYPNNINGYYSSTYTTIKLSAGCDNDYVNECIYRQLIYRSSFSLFLVFLLLSGLSYCNEYCNRSYWVLKYAGAGGIFVAFFWGSNAFFSGWAETARFISEFFLLAQGFLLFDLASDLHDVIMANADVEDSNSGGDSRGWYAAYIFLTLGSLTCAGVGLGFLFVMYTGCQLGMFFTVLTLILGVLTTIVSMLDTVSKGILTPAIMFAYAVFICWYALLSCPQGSCNPFASVNNGRAKDSSIIIIVIITCSVLLYCVANGTRIMDVFNPEGQGVLQQSSQLSMPNELSAVLTDSEAPAATNLNIDKKESGSDNSDTGLTAAGAAIGGEQSSGTPPERAFFHVLMLLAACYGAMVLTSWGRTDGSPEVELYLIFPSMISIYFSSIFKIK